MEVRLADARRHEAEDLAFREIFEAWLVDGVSREDGNAELRRAFERDVLPAIGDKPVRLLVDDSDLRATLRRVGRDRGAGRTAQRMLSELRKLYRWSLSRKPWRTLVPFPLFGYRVISSYSTFDVADKGIPPNPMPVRWTLHNSSRP